jgi:hypothetical protein
MTFLPYYLKLFALIAAELFYFSSHMRTLTVTTPLKGVSHEILGSFFDM